MFIWDEAKNEKLKAERGISFEEIVVLIMQKHFLEILEHPAKPSQKIFVLEWKGYIHAVPFILDEKENIVLKTVFPSRKLHKQYRRET